jgi:hypothetical protein
MGCMSSTPSSDPVGTNDVAVVTQKAHKATPPAAAKAKATSAASPKNAKEDKQSRAKSPKAATSKPSSPKSGDGEGVKKKKKKTPGKLQGKDLDLTGKGAVTKAGKAYKCELKGNKWMIDNATKAEGTIEIEVTSMRQSVYIFNANEATIVVKGKCNSIAVDKCNKSKVLCDTLVAMLE